MMMAAILPILVALLVLHHQVRGLESAQCSAGNESKFRFSVSSRRNATGHRLVEVKISEHVYDAAVDAGIELAVNVEQAHIQCNKSEALISTAVTEASRVPSRRPDYELFSGLGYYKMHTKAQTWDQARMICLEEGAHLLFVNSDREFRVVQHFLRKFFARKYYTAILVGFNDRDVEGQYVTELGQPLSSSSFTKWSRGEPSNVPSACSDPDEDCGAMNNDGELFTTGCSCKFPFICEQEL